MSLSISITSVVPGTPVLYVVVVSQDKGETYELRRRYSDFLRLAEDAATELGEAVPVPPPVKPPSWRSWRALSPDELEDRRVALEGMLRALVRAPDFASSLSLSRFLELGRHKRREGTSNADWMSSTAKISRLVGEARAAPSSTARQKLVQARTMVGVLQRNLDQFSVGQGEYQRRQQQLDGWLLTIQNLEKSLVDAGASTGTLISTANLSTQANSSTHSGRTLGPVPETDATRIHNNAGLLASQRTTMTEQDAEIDGLREALSRQKELAFAISAEAEKQNQLLDELDDDVHRVNVRLNRARRDTSHLH